jgi:hypothetical protein
MLQSRLQQEAAFNPNLQLKNGQLELAGAAADQASFMRQKHDINMQMAELNLQKERTNNQFQRDQLSTVIRNLKLKGDALSQQINQNADMFTKRKELLDTQVRSATAQAQGLENASNFTTNMINKLSTDPNYINDPKNQRSLALMGMLSGGLSPQAAGEVLSVASGHAQTTQSLETENMQKQLEAMDQTIKQKDIAFQTSNEQAKVNLEKAKQALDLAEKLAPEQVKQAKLAIEQAEQNLTLGKEKHGLQMRTGEEALKQSQAMAPLQRSALKAQTEATEAKTDATEIQTARTEKLFELEKSQIKAKIQNIQANTQALLKGLDKKDADFTVNDQRFTQHVDQTMLQFLKQTDSGDVANIEDPEGFKAAVEAMLKAAKNNDIAKGHIRTRLGKIKRDLAKATKDRKVRSTIVDAIANPVITPFVDHSDILLDKVEGVKEVDELLKGLK